MRTMNRPLFIVALLLILGVQTAANATEYFVSKQGNDAADGASPQTALATIQKAVNLLQPGDILTIRPGEYSESIKRINLGGPDNETLIRAEIPGTVLLRGDRIAPEFRPLAGYRFVYVADFNFNGDIPAVNELDTLAILKRMPNITELEFIPGTFFHDPAAKKLYLSSSDMRSPQSHRYSISVIPTHGIHLVRPQRVTIQGIAVTGYSAMALLSYREETAGGVWGIFIAHGKNCAIRDCHAYLNAWGIGINSEAPGSGGNVIQRCAAWANKSPFANGDMGGLTIFRARQDAIRESTAYLNGMYGINIYGTGGAPPGTDDGGNAEQLKSLLSHNLAWGNATADIKIKTGYEYFHRAQNCVAPGLWSVTNVDRSLIGREGHKDRSPDNIVLSNHAGIDPQAEFADPDHHDYRLQATSRFRAQAPAAADAGPFPYTKDIYYVRPDGDDQADGLSIQHARKSLAAIVPMLQPGDTLYLNPGAYRADLDLQLTSVSIRGRGNAPAIIEGAIRTKDSRAITFQRLHFRGPVQLNSSTELAFEHCRFSATGTSLEASEVRDLRVSQCLFTQFKQGAIVLNKCSQTHLSGNLYDNAQGPALRLTDPASLRYSSYNSYRVPETAWQTAGQTQPLAQIQATHDQQSIQAIPQFDAADQLQNPNDFAARGPFGKPIGPFQNQIPQQELRLVIKPTLHSVSATTANIEWTVSLPSACKLAWGETPACLNTETFNVNCFGTFSLTGLKPAQTYYFRIKSIEIPADMAPKIDAKPIELNDPPISFTTAAKNNPPATYYVAPNGDDQNSGLTPQQAWKTINHAAQIVNAGDTALIAGGTYYERVRFRATGETDAPITFRALPGQRVNIDGKNMALHTAFVVGGKSHLRFDGFYFSNFNIFPNDGWSLLYNGEFHLYSGKDIQITRCFSEGRGGYSAGPIAAFHIENLVIKNCVNTNKFGGMYFWRCPNLLIQNTVFASPMIMAFVLRNEKDQKATMQNCIFTDMLDKKARLNIALLCVDGAVDSFRHDNNCYLLRAFPTEQRILCIDKPIGQLEKYIANPLFADPMFAGDPGDPKGAGGFPPDRLMEPALKLDFNSFFATNPQLIQRGIGLQPEAFKEWNFPPHP